MSHRSRRYPKDPHLSFPLSHHRQSSPRYYLALIIHHLRISCSGRHHDIEAISYQRSAAICHCNTRSDTRSSSGAMISIGLRKLLAVGATAFVASFSVMDANPSLFIFDRFVVNGKRLQDHFRGKNIWIAGASSGIGAELARHLSRHGANVILSSRPSERLEAVALSCRELSTANTVSVVPLDMTASENDLEIAVDQVKSMLGSGSLDCVILNAGRGQLAPASKTSYETTEQIFRLNTLAPISLTSILFQRGLLQENKGSHMVVTSSVGGKFGVPLSASYSASKHALHGYYNSLRSECPWLRVDLICPGPVATAFHKSHIGREAIHGNAPEKPVRELKMSVERCASLLVSSMLMDGGCERWISEHPTLLALYINQYFPGLFQKALQKIGPVRLKAWEEGKNLYDPNTWKRSGK
jgi:dehydrogenase/reductase SDR family protein 7